MILSSAFASDLGGLDAYAFRVHYCVDTVPWGWKNVVH